MALTDPFVLPRDTVLLPVHELPENLRRQIQAKENDFAISRPNSRTQSKIIHAEAADLLRQFETPRTIAQAVARYSRGRKEDAERVLEEAFPLLQSLIASQLLVAADSKEAAGTQPSLAPRDIVEGWTIIQCVQTLNDTELFQTRGPNGQFAALKIARSGMPPVMNSLLNREARVLSQLDGRVAPRLLGSGQWNDRPYLLIEWCAGVEVNRLCLELRQAPDSRAELLRLAIAIVDGYALLHEQGVIHGDVHPRNIFVDRDQEVKIIDFGLARCVDEVDKIQAQRGGVGFFLEPEFARAVLNGRNPPLLTMAGEQYAVGVMLYFLFTGSHYLEFSLERDKMLRQIAQNCVLPFAHRDTQPWPEVEKILEKALSKNPAERFSSMRNLCDALRAVKAPSLGPEPVRAPDTKLQEMKRTWLQKLGLTGPLLTGGPLPAPAVSVNYGAAGVAYALYRMACATEEPELLALADAWCTKGMREIGDECAFYDQKFDITPETVGRTSLYHSAAGVYVVQALIAQARGDFLLQQLATTKFIDISAPPCDKLDVTLGRAGTLLACSFLLNTLPALKLPEGSAPADGLRSLGHKTAVHLWQIVESYAPIRESTELSNLGVAHGWAGLLYSMLCWSAVSHDPLPPNLGERLAQLGELGEPVGRGLRWPWHLARGIAEPAGYMPGWCNGSSGYVFLWTQAHKMLGEAEYLARAEGAAWDAWKTPSQTGHLCCGMAGQAYALIKMYRHTGEGAWLSRARTIMRRAATVADHGRSRPGYEQLAQRPESLYKGDLGVILLAADLECPEHARMPLFELEG